MLGFLHSPKRRDDSRRKDAFEWWDSLSDKKQDEIEDDLYGECLVSGDTTDIDIEVMYTIYKLGL